MTESWPNGSVDALVKETIMSKLSKIQAELDEIDSTDSVEYLSALLVEANSWINLLCGEDEDLYNKWRYRLFVNSENKVIVLHGEEIDVNYRAWTTDSNQEIES